LGTTKVDHLLLIDGLNIVRRVYEAIPVPDSPEKAIGATRSSIASIRRALVQHSPTHVLAAFDHGGPTWRHELYPDYHKSRKPMPEPLSAALPTIRGQIQQLGVPTLRFPGVEADDVLATVYGHWAAKERGTATILSTDKDLAALIAQGAQVYDHFAQRWRDEAWAYGKFGVSTSQLQDLLALAGDSTDDIPGVPGVGVKTAAKWLNTFGSLEELLSRANEVSGKVGEALRANLDQARLARQLVAFKSDLSLGLTWNALRFDPANAAA
jgi:protein Xni